MGEEEEEMIEIEGEREKHIDFIEIEEEENVIEGFQSKTDVLSSFKLRWKPRTRAAVGSNYFSNNLQLSPYFLK